MTQNVVPDRSDVQHAAICERSGNTLRGLPEHDDYEIEFRWKEEVVYWEGARGIVFPGGWGVEPVETIVPDAETWDRAVPAWLKGRHDVVVGRLRGDLRHVVHEERDDSSVVTGYVEVTR